MLKIRLQRTGRKNNASFRVVVGEHTNAAQSGKFVEVLGSYEPKSGKYELKEDRIKYWISKGAQPSGTVHNTLVDKKIIEGKKINVLPKKTKQVKELTEEEKAAQAAPVAEAAPEASSAEGGETPAEAAPTEETA